MIKEDTVLTDNREQRAPDENSTHTQLYSNPAYESVTTMNRSFV